MSSQESQVMPGQALGASESFDVHIDPMDGTRRARLFWCHCTLDEERGRVGPGTPLADTWTEGPSPVPALPGQLLPTTTATGGSARGRRAPR